MIRRRSTRNPRRLQVTFWRRGDPQGHPGYTTNISMHGMFIGSSSPLPQKTRLRIEVHDREHGFVVEGVVAHARKMPPELGVIALSGMGVRFLSVEELVGELLPGSALSLAEEVAQPSAEPVAAVPAASAAAPAFAPAQAPAAASAPAARPASPAPPPVTVAPPAPAPAAPFADGDGVFHVRFADPGQFLTVFRRDIVNGGLFVSTLYPGRLQEVVNVELHPPGPWAEPIRLRARVVHRREPDGVGGTNLLAGMGVEVIDAQVLCERLRPLVEKLAGS